MIGSRGSLLLVGLLTVVTPRVFADTIALRTGTLIDVDSGRTQHGQVILVENGFISKIGTNVEIPAGATVIDLSAEWVLPGLMDAHTHLGLKETSGAPLETIELRESSAARALRGLRNAQLLLHAGFTTVRDLGFAGEYTLVDVRRAIEQGWYVGPTVLTCGKLIGPFGGLSAAIPSERGPFWRGEAIDADGPEAVRRAVREAIYYGADVIKLVGDGRAFQYSVDELRAAVDEAHRAGRPVAIHIMWGGAAADAAIDAGVDSIEHGFDLTDIQLQKMKARGIFLVGTDFPREHLEIIGTGAGELPEPAILAAKIIDRLRRAHKIGVKMAFGPDIVLDLQDRSRTDLMFDYLKVWRDAGITSAETLKAMTSGAAELLRVDRTRGRLAPGLAADIIAVPEDPIANTEALRRVDFVMRNGMVVRSLAHVR